MSCQRELAERVTYDLIYNDKLRVKFAVQVNPRIRRLPAMTRDRDLCALTLPIARNCQARP